MALTHAGSQHLLITLLGTYFYGQTKPIPSAFLVRLLQEFGVTEVGARNGLSRVAKRGLLELSKPGRQTYYRLSEDAHAHHAERLSEIVNFGVLTEPWDGTWSIVMFSVAEKDRADRHLARQRLTGLRFAMLFDGVWVRPGALPAATVAALKSLEVQKATIFTGAEVAESLGPGDPVDAFPLHELREQYGAFVEELRPFQERMDAGDVGSAEALLRRTEVMHNWRFFPDNDPLLPPAILPDGWPLLAAREAFLSIYDGLAELADLRLRGLLADYDPELAEEVRSLTSSELRQMNIPAKRMGPLTGMP